MFGNPYGTGLSFTKVLSGISKTLNVAGQVISLYKEAKPMINNAKTIFGVLKEVGKGNSKETNKTTTSSIKKEVQKKDTATIKTVSNNTPKFFL